MINYLLSLWNSFVIVICEGKGEGGELPEE